MSDLRKKNTNTKTPQQQINEDDVQDVFSKITNSKRGVNNNSNHNTHTPTPNPQIHPNNSNNRPSNSNKMVIDSDEEREEKQMNQLLENAKLSKMEKEQSKINGANGSRKQQPQPQQISAIKSKQNGHKMQIESVAPKPKKRISFVQLPEEVVFYLTEVYQFSQNKLFITGMLLNSNQTINIVANETYRELYFALKKEQLDSQAVSEAFKEKAEKQIKQRLANLKITNYFGQFEDKQYVFELDNVCRSKRPYYKVRYSFSKDKENPNDTNLSATPSPDMEGTYFKYVFGTTYTPLELFLMNTSIKGPCWVKVEKDLLTQNKRNVENGNLCVDINNVEEIIPAKQYTKPPCMRVMSISLKAVVPSQLQKKQLFKTNKIDQTHIYCISYTYCENYVVEIKPAQYHTTQRTFYLQSFGKLNDPNFTQCSTEVQMIAQFQNDLNILDPDVIVCHDSAKILDVLIQRMVQINEKANKPRLGRLIHYQGINTHNQLSRLTSAIAGRLLVDTFLHSKDMIKSIDYELQSMAKNIKPERTFVGYSQEETKSYLDEGKTFFVLKKVRDQAQITMALMNHLQVLQLTRQLSNICGNLWKRSLENQRAERNQYLIMHECKNRKLIIPDKFRIVKNQEDVDQGDKKKYIGGMVLEPKKGMYNDFILLLDFNSLYPSIIRQYNICFSILDRPRMPLSKYFKVKGGGSKKDKSNKNNQNKIEEENINDQDEEIQPPPKSQCVRQKWGFLPLLIDGIVTQRNKCKKAMKSATPEKCIILDIQQKSYKIVANSIYGCLGFSISRFYSKPMAALITRMGRQALQKANDIVSAKGGVEVIYGDTDSLMIQPTSLNKQTDKQKLFQIKTIADELKKGINKEYSNLEIDIDGIFKPIILLMKKKYVANKLTNFDKIIAKIDSEPQYALQYKGIQVVRRDGCEIARASLKKILQILMNSNKQDQYQIYEQIYEYAKELNEKLPNINYKEFLFSKQLSKKPKQYHRGETIPHVKVALDRMKNGQKQQTLVNHTIYYLVTKQQIESQDSLAKKCIDDKTFQRSRKFPDPNQQPYQIDFDYYKEQILQPWMRIFIHLEQFNLHKLFDSFGVEDSKRKKIKKFMDETEKDNVETGLRDFLTNDMKEKSSKFNEETGGDIIKCANCNNTMSLSENGQFIVKCKFCPIDNSKFILSVLSNKISWLIKQKSTQYYSNKFKCECQKQYSLTPISRCCRVQAERKTIIPFQLHTFVYLTKQISQMTIKKNYGLNQEVCKRLKQMNQKVLDRFLENSDYENIDGIMDCFSI